MQASLIHPARRYRVELTPQGFTETTDHRETGIAVEINEHKETRVWWVAVGRIDVTDEHAFFTITDKGYLLLPRSAFATDASFRDFVDVARNYREAARLALAPPVELPRPQETRITS